MIAISSRRLMVALLFAFAWVPVSASDSVASLHDWEVVVPDSIGLDGAQLSELINDIRANKYLNIHSLLVIRHGKLAVEEYFAGNDERRGEPIGVVQFNRETLHDVRSITKSVTSMLFGIALTEGAIADVNVPVLDFFPEYDNLRTPERMAIRLRDLLSMTPGIKWDEDSHPYGDSRNSETAMDRAIDPYRFVLEQEVVSERGKEFQYNGGTTMLLAAVIERATKMPLDKYAERKLFGPLGIDHYEWLRYSSGELIAASGLRLLPRDVAKLGVMYLNHGHWHGEQIVPESWVQDSLSPHATIHNRPTGFRRYGYQWFIGTARVGDAYIPFSAAVGWGGQRLLIVPSMDLVVVLTAGLYNSPRQTDITFEIMLDRVLPAVI